MGVILYDRSCNCPTSELARRALRKAGVTYESRPLDTHPVDRNGALQLAREARRFLVKDGDGFVQHDASREPVREAQALVCFRHGEGRPRVPVLVGGDMLVRGYRDELYERALAELPATEGGRPATEGGRR